MQNILSSVINFFTLIFTGDIETLIKSIGVLGVWIVVFAESGLLVGFFLPGDSLLFTAGLLASPAFKFLDLWVLLLGAWVAAIVGDNVGYEFGKRVGRRLFKKEESLLFNPKNLEKANVFYETHGGKAITIARFIPIVRTFVPIIAGISHMDHKKFTLYNFLGGTIWVWGMVLGGYFLGSIVPNVDKYILPVILLIIIGSVLPPAWHLYKENRDSINRKVKNIFASNK